MDAVRALANVSAPDVEKVDVAVPPKDALFAESVPAKWDVEVAAVATIEGVEIVPFVAIVVVAVAPKEVRPMKLLELLNWEVPVTEMEVKIPAPAVSALLPMLIAPNPAAIEPDESAPLDGRETLPSENTRTRDPAPGKTPWR